MRRAARVLGAAIVLSGLLVQPAMAGQPTRERFVDSGEFDIDCGTFMLHETYMDALRVSERMVGDVIHIQVHHRFSGEISGPGGAVLIDRATFTNFVTIATDGERDRQVGIVYRYVVPGLGLVAHDAGIIEFDALTGEVVRISGPHDVWETGLEALICPLFE
jgi:hypothetical protein